MARLKEAEREKVCEEVGRVVEPHSDDPKSRRYGQPSLGLKNRNAWNLRHSSNLMNSRLLPRPSFGILFDYAYDYDKKGIIYWIATNRGRGILVI